MACIVMERTLETPLTDQEMAQQGRRLDDCLELRSSAWVRSYLARDGKRMICEFEAPDAESVREALRAAGQPFDRVWPATVHAAEDYPEHRARLDRLRKAAR